MLRVEWINEIWETLFTYNDGVDNLQNIQHQRYHTLQLTVGFLSMHIFLSSSQLLNVMIQEFNDQNT